ncbi:MAG: Ppx/GppA family phosphatase, partial [Myxococcales bacterium]|nr:Ppx/GppA family phosphatase [Myxococcales bacterium]
MKGVIDIGSNSVLLLLGERAEGGALTIVEDLARVARLSQGVAASGRLHPEAIERTLAVLREYKA